MLMVSLWYPVAEGYNPNPEDIFTSPLGLPISDRSTFPKSSKENMYSRMVYLSVRAIQCAKRNVDIKLSRSLQNSHHIA